MKFLDRKVSLAFLEKFRPCHAGAEKLREAAGSDEISLRAAVANIGLPETLWACRIAEHSDHIVACRKFIAWAATEVAKKHVGVPPPQMHPSVSRFMCISARATNQCPHKIMLAAYFAMVDSGTHTTEEITESFLRFMEA